MIRSKFTFTAQLAAGTAIATLGYVLSAASAMAQAADRAIETGDPAIVVTASGFE